MFWPTHFSSSLHPVLWIFAQWSYGLVKYVGFYPEVRNTWICNREFQQRSWRPLVDLGESSVRTRAGNAKISVETLLSLTVDCVNEWRRITRTRLLVIYSCSTPDLWIQWCILVKANLMCSSIFYSTPMFIFLMMYQCKIGIHPSLNFTGRFNWFWKC